jgi:iron complex outermembrane recepter protein
LPKQNSWLVLSLLGYVSSIALSQPAVAQVKSAHKKSTTDIPRLSEVKFPATDVKGLLSQSTPSNSSSQEDVIQVTSVKANPTDKGVEVILQTVKGQQLQVTNRSADNNFIADIPNAQLRLPSGEAFTFRSEKPIAGVSEITVTNLDANTIRVRVTGEAGVPTVELFDSPDEGLIFSVAGAATSAQQPQQPETSPQQQQEPTTQTQPTQPSAQGDEPIELVVTGEQDGYRVPNASVGTRTDTPIRDIPASIQVIPRQVLEDQRVNQVREAVTNVSGVTPGGQGSQTGAGGSFIIRGFQTDRDNLFVNGFRRYNFLNRELEVANIEQIEILKGPASVLYGQGEPGGILNITTKQPLSTPFYGLEATIGNFDFYRTTIDFSGSLNADKTIRYRLNGAYQNSGSFIDFVDTEQVFVAPVISFDIGENTTLTLEGEYLNTSQVSYQGLPASGSVLANPFGRVPRSRYVNDPDLKLERDFVAIGYRLQHKFSENWAIRNGFRAELDNFTENFSFITGLQPNNRTVNRSARFDERSVNNYFLQTDVIGKIQTGSIKQDLLFGVEFAWLNDDSQLLNPSPALPPIDLFNPNYSRPSIRPSTPLRDVTEHQNLIGIDAQDLISIADNLKILLGGRFDFAKASLDDRPSTVSPNPVSRDQESTAFSPRVGIVYQPIPPVSLYASYSQSFQPSRANSVNADSSPFKPTTGEAFEVGVKTEFLDGRLAATLAAYQITKQNIVVSDPNRVGFSLQVGEQRSRGIEFDIAGEILPGWKIIGSYTYIDAEITEDTRPAFKGNTPNNVPRNSASLWTTYEFQTGGLRGFGFGGGVTFVGDRQGDLGNTFTLPSYVRTDAAVFYRRDNWRIGLNIKNLFDTYYFEGSNSRNAVFPAAPFTVLGTISVQF